MTDIDTRLREQAERWRATHADLPVPSLPPLAAHRALRPHGLLAVAASVVAVALVGTGLAVYGHDHPRRTSPDTGTVTVHVPWSPVGQVPDTSDHFEGSPPGASRAMRTCTASDLRVVSVRTTPPSRSDMAGWLETSVLMRSSAASRCAVPYGGLQATLLSEQGTALPVDGPGYVTHGPIAQPTRQIVSPGDDVRVTATWAADTSRVPRPTHLTVWLMQYPASDPVTVRLGNATIPPPPAMPSNAAWRSAVYADVEGVVASGSIASLTPTVSAPAFVRADAVLRYTVTLANATDVVVPLRPCPTVAQHVDVKGVRSVQGTGTVGPLNCAAAPRAIAPGRSVVLDYEVTLPPNLTGFALLDWAVIDGANVLLSVEGHATVN